MTLDYIFKKCTGKTCDELSSESELIWYDKYADGRDSGSGILAANWNHFPKLNARESHRTSAGKSAQDYNWGKGRKFQDILERKGYQLEWSDQTDRCDDCGGCIQTSPDSWDWQPQYHVFSDGSIVCEACIKESPSDYLDDCEDNPRRAVWSWIDPAEHGYTLIESSFENGFHPDQNDNPESIYRALQDKGYSGILFQITDKEQFCIKFAVYAREMPETAGSETDSETKHAFDD